MKKKLTIREYVSKLLEVKNRRVKNPGHPYLKILEMVRDKFPSSKTSIGNINWYATKLRQAGVELPDRPRSNNKQPKDIVK